MPREMKLEDMVMIRRIDNTDHGVSLFQASCILQVRTALTTENLKIIPGIKEQLAKQIKEVFNGMLKQWRMGDIDPDKIPDHPDNLSGEWITTPEVIALFTMHGIPCDQATVSGLARQGRYIAKKMAGSWVFDRQTVMQDIQAVHATRVANNKKWMEV